jgi:hypothetical protein
MYGKSEMNCIFIFVWIKVRDHYSLRYKVVICQVFCRFLVITEGTLDYPLFFT